jgi:hypothetical protein
MSTPLAGVARVPFAPAGIYGREVPSVRAWLTSTRGA